MAILGVIVAVTQMAWVGCAWGFWSSSARVAPLMVAFPWMVMRRCPAGGSLISSGVMRWIASTVVTPGKMSFQSMIPVGSVHVGAVRWV